LVAGDRRGVFREEVAPRLRSGQASGPSTSLRVNEMTPKGEAKKKRIPRPHLRQRLRPLTAGKHATGLGMTRKAEAEKKQIPRFARNDNGGVGGWGRDDPRQRRQKQIPHRHSRDNLFRPLAAGKRGTGFGMTIVEWAIMMRGHGCSACHPEPGRLVLANGGEGSALDNLSFGIGAEVSRPGLPRPDCSV